MSQQVAFEGFDVAVDNKAKLEAKFIIPPFSVLDTRQGYWSERKRLWLGLGIQSEIGRGDELLHISEQAPSHYKNTKPVGRADGLTWGESDAMRHPTPNYYREKNKASSRQEADKRSNVTGAPPKPEWATGTGTTNMAPGTSIFDPVVVELIYKWFCPDNGHILDPFAGGSVRGVVASVLQDGYTGIDLSSVQIEANRKQAREIVPHSQPEWIVGDSYELDALLPVGKHYDLIFSCPPYHDLEQYTDDPADLSNMSWGTFKERYKSIIEKCILRLNSNRFACFVVSEIRDENGGYKGLVPLTIQCFVQGGMRYYNEMILVNVAGSLPIRVAGQFQYRKIGRTHQNVLVFYKGDIEQIPKNFKEIDTAFAYNGNGDGKS